MKDTLKKEGGFTIVELIVAMGLFVVITAVAVAAFTQALRSEQRLTAVMSVDSSASAALEQMVREIRTGYNFQYQPSSAATHSLSFVSPEGNVTFSLQNNVIVRQTSAFSSPITSSNVKVKNLQFLVNQPEGDFCAPWRVTISMVVADAQATDSTQDIMMQTTASSRILPREVPFSDKQTSPHPIINCK